VVGYLRSQSKLDYSQ